MSPCSVCGAYGGSRFDVAHFDQIGTQKFATSVCSLKCLIQWSYKYAQLHGMMMAYQAKNAFTSLLDALKGVKS